jgi:hypothetical protein
MTYRVLWKLTAIQQLNAIAVDAVDPVSIRQAAAFVDYALRRDPLNMGESRSGRDRLWYWDVLGIYFRVNEAELLVEVLLVGPSKRR